MTYVCFDCESALIRPGTQYPELVCVSYQMSGAPDAQLVHVRGAREFLYAWFSNPDIHLVGHHLSYDVGVVCARFPELFPLAFQAYDDGRMHCTKIRQQLLDLARGEHRGRHRGDGTFQKFGYSLDDLSQRYRGHRLDKDTWRLRYAEFLDIPLDQWPEGARIYPKEDAVATKVAYDCQETERRLFISDTGLDPFGDEANQVRGQMWKSLMSAWGLRTRKAGVDKLRAEALNARSLIESRLKELGLIRKDGTRDTKLAMSKMEAAWKASGATPRLTDTGRMSLDEESCDECGDPDMEAYGEYGKLGSVLSKDVKALAAGTRYPVHTRFDLADSGRSTSSGPNVQNWRRLPGIRECFVPRKGWLYAQADYDQLELRTLAQTCLLLLGESSLATALNAGLDPHTEVASSILEIPVEEGRKRRKDKADKEFDDARQLGKCANFGYPGGLGARTFIDFAKATYKVDINVEKARQLKVDWFNAWPEMREFFQMVNTLPQDHDGKRRVVQVFSNRIRGGASYTAACNSYFQGLGADATSRAGWLLAKACYLPSGSPLYGCRPVCYVHDEFLVECPDDERSHDVAMELARVMVEGANELLPDVPASTEPLLMRYWSKDAKTVRDANGRIIPWGDVYDV